ncbi:hypothetical protein VH441_09035 [Psychrobacter sp. HD31]|uniref:hypothetical protein n=1 Tax=Psychrobacter sp. HD31 TaxID=3112003 RepID=UPI003DA450B1
MKKILLITSTVFLLSTVSGCVTTPKSDIKPVINYANTFKFETDHRLSDLTIVTKGQRSSAAVGQVLNFLVGTGSASTFTKDDLIGKKIIDTNDTSVLENPIYDINSSLKKRLESQDKKLDEYLSPIILSNATPLWKIVYVNGNTNYQLTFGAKLSRDENSIQKGLFGNQEVIRKRHIYCEYRSEELPLEEWKANNYQKVANLKSEVIDTCMEKFIPALSTLTNDEFKVKIQ